LRKSTTWRAGAVERLGGDDQPVGHRKTGNQQLGQIDRFASDKLPIEACT